MKIQRSTVTCAMEIAFSFAFADEPLSFAEAMHQPDADKWRQAALEELGAHQSNGTWKLVDKPPGAKVIGVSVILPVFVDDMTFVSCSKGTISSLVQQLGSHFKIRDLGPTTSL